MDNRVEIRREHGDTAELVHQDTARDKEHQRVGTERADENDYALFEYVDVVTDDFDEFRELF